MNKEEIFTILPGILRNETLECDNEEKYVDLFMEDPLDYQNVTEYRYQVLDDGFIQIQKRENDEACGEPVVRSLRDVVWQKCKLDRVCAIYKKNYNTWKDENNGVPFIETQLIGEKNGKAERSLAFIRDFWKCPLDGNKDGFRNLNLLLAEYGVGKTSYCHSIRKLAQEEVKEEFFSQQAAFPFVFDLNEFCCGDFDKFIETELLEKYMMGLEYPVFEKLCQEGIFMVVLDAWDQMRSAANVLKVNQDLKQMSALWGGKGRILITCRRSFYQQQLKEIGGLSGDAELYRLNGFDKESAIDYIVKYNANQVGGNLVGGDPKTWVQERWAMNSSLFEKPLNLRLLVKYYVPIANTVDLLKRKVNTYEFLEIAYRDWKEKNGIADESFLKKLVSQTLISGLNRRIPVAQLQKACEADSWSSIYSELGNFVFVKKDNKKGTIEFYLAAYQEFLWAYFSIQELQVDLDKVQEEKGSEEYKLILDQFLIKNYLLISEVREWVCMKLREVESDCLQRQIFFVKYKKKEEVGYWGSNALNILCDLNARPYYRKQFREMKRDLSRRPLQGVDFHGLDLTNASFYLSDLLGADFSYAKLSGADFTGADLAGTTWRDHGQMKRCTFFYGNGSLGAAAGTNNGSVLTYWIQDKRQEVVNLRYDMVNDLAADGSGIYAVTANGMTGYMNQSREAESTCISQSSLWSVACAGEEKCIYIGADSQQIFAYDWNRKIMRPIEIIKEKNQQLGSEAEWISDIQCYVKEDKKYIAYTMSSGQWLVLLKLSGAGKATVEAFSQLKSGRFGNICFADGRLVYSISGKGIYAMPVEEAVGGIPEHEMLNKDQKLFPQQDMKVYVEEFIISWAEKAGKLLALEKRSDADVKIMREIDLSNGFEERTVEEIELDWFYGNQDYGIASNELEGFCVSDDGKFAAVSGKSLAVFQNMGPYYGLYVQPVEARISCEGVRISGCLGLDKAGMEFLTGRGASWSNEGKEIK